MNNEILNLNSNQKYFEEVLYLFDNGDENLTLKEIREKVKLKYPGSTKLLNQYFGLMRLLPLILIKEVYKEDKYPLEGDIAKIKIIRDSIAHNNFVINTNEYKFSNNSGSISFSYDEFNSFIHKIENKFYQNKF